MPAAIASLLGILIQATLLVLLIVGVVAVVKLPALIQRLISMQTEAQGTMREILAEIRSVTQQDG